MHMEKRHRDALPIIKATFNPRKTNGFDHEHEGEAVYNILFIKMVRVVIQNYAIAYSVI